LPCCDQNRLKILSATRITSDAVAKQWLSTNGAIQAAMMVVSDFIDYSGGVYVPQSGNDVGGHCVCIIGYDDVQGCWICKNSWSTEWGEDGFFRIAYGQCGIFRDYAGYGYKLANSPGPTPDPTPVPPTPIPPKGDIVLPSDGILLVMPIKEVKTSSLVIQPGGEPDMDIPLKKAQTYRYKSLGDFQAGGLTFGIRDKAGNLTHNVRSQKSGKNLWLMWMRTAAGAYDYSFQFKLIPASQGVEDLMQSEMMQAFLGIEEGE
jgi:hypothetical protein